MRVLPDCRELGNCSKSSVGLTSFLGSLQSLSLPSAQQGRKAFLWLTANFKEMKLYFWTLHLEFQLIFQSIKWIWAIDDRIQGLELCEFGLICGLKKPSDNVTPEGLNFLVTE